MIIKDIRIEELAHQGECRRLLRERKSFDLQRRQRLKLKELLARKEYSPPKDSPIVRLSFVLVEPVQSSTLLRVAQKVRIPRPKI